MAALNKLRRRDHVANMAMAAVYRRSGMLPEARKFLAYARFDRDCATRGGWRLP